MTAEFYSQIVRHLGSTRPLPQDSHEPLDDADKAYLRQSVEGWSSRRFTEYLVSVRNAPPPPFWYTRRPTLIRVAHRVRLGVGSTPSEAMAGSPPLRDQESRDNAERKVDWADETGRRASPWNAFFRGWDVSQQPRTLPATLPPDAECLLIFPRGDKRRIRIPFRFLQRLALGNLVSGARLVAALEFNQHVRIRLENGGERHVVDFHVTERYGHGLIFDEPPPSLFGDPDDPDSQLAWVTDQPYEYSLRNALSLLER